MRNHHEMDGMVPAEGHPLGRSKNLALVGNVLTTLGTHVALRNVPPADVRDAPGHRGARGRGALGRAEGGGRTAHGALRLVGRLPLDARRTVYLVRAGSRVLVLGVSEAGLNKLAEFPADEVPDMKEPAESMSFGEVLARIRGTTTREDPGPDGSSPSTRGEEKGSS